MRLREPASQREIEAAKNGSEPALAAIITYAMPMIQRLARRATRPGLDFEDAVQEGLIGLFSAIEHFSPDCGASFTTYSRVCVSNAILTAQRAASRKKHAPLNQSVPLSEEHSTPGPEEQAIASEQISLTLEKARRNLSPFERQVIRLRMTGFSSAEISAHTGHSVKSVENALRRARAKLR